MGLLDSLLGSRDASGAYSGGLLSIPGQLAGGLLGSVITPVQRGLWGTSSQDIAAQRKQLLDQAQQDHELQRQLLQMQLEAAQTAQAQRQEDDVTGAKMGAVLGGYAPGNVDAAQFNAQNPGGLQMMQTQARRRSPDVVALQGLAATASGGRVMEGNPMLKALMTPQKLGSGDIVGSPLGGTLMSSPYPPGSGSMPASLQEWEAFQRMGPDDRQAYLNMKRQPAQPQVVMVNGVPTIVDKVNRTQSPLSTIGSENDAAAARAAATAEGTATGTQRGEIKKKGINAQQTLDTLDLAEPLIDAATGSVAGAGADKLAAVFGSAPKGAQAIAQLRILQANIMTSMPRMEGPQSDKDVDMYRQAAGEIGDPMVPREQKKAAVRTIRALQQKYQQRAAGVGANNGPAVGSIVDGWRFKGGNPADRNSWEPPQ